MCCAWLAKAERASLEFKRCRGQERSAYESEGVEIYLKGEEYASVFFSGYSHSNSIFTPPFLFILCPSPILFSLLPMPPMLPHAVLVHLHIISHHIVSSFCPTHCFKPISQIGSRGPIAHLGVSRQGPNWRQSRVRGVGRDSIPTSAQCCLDGSSPWG